MTDARKKIRSESGVALLMTLWVVTLLSVIAAEFCMTMRQEIQITRTLKERMEAAYIAEAGVQRTLRELMAKRPNTGTRKAADADMETESDPWHINGHIPNMPFANGYYQVTIGNQSGRIDLNRAGRGLLLAILERFAVTGADAEVVADSILDWRDSDHNHRLNGAEDDYYESLPEPYTCKDSDFSTVGELRRVRGVTAALYDAGFGDMFVIPYEMTDKGKKKKTASKNKKQSVKVDINSAPAHVLRHLPKITDPSVDAILDARKIAPIRSNSEIKDLIGAEAFNAVKPYITVSHSNVYEITSVGWINHSRVRRGVSVLAWIRGGGKPSYRILERTVITRTPFSTLNKKAGNGKVEG
ncbi:MAG: hypothetical protein CSA22_04060 [Deltaproteobacteria bacterium]|nr:MAG: hypothetical protein CSA22_04060 [Deltaproteobacteria bacterium]